MLTSIEVLGRLSRMTLLVLIALTSARPAFASRPPTQNSASVIIIRDVDGDGVRDLARYAPDSHDDPYGPAEVVVVAGARISAPGEQPPREIARFRVETELELMALAARHPTDLNDDQRIDHLDVQLLGRRLGHTLRVRGGPGDVDRNGLVDAADMTSLLLTVAPRGGAAWIRWSSNWPAGFHPDNGDRGLWTEFKRECGWKGGEFFCTIQGGPGDPGDLGIPGGGGGPSDPPEPPDDCGITFTPDPLTHLPNASEAMALPGDWELIYAEVDKECTSPPSPVYYKINDPEVALIRDGSGSVEWIEGAADETIQIVGLTEGFTRLEAYADKLDGEFLGSINIKVGGTIAVDYWNAPTFTPTVYDAKPPAPSQIPGDIAPPERGPIPPEVYLAANALPDDPCEFRIAVKDADGQPKPGKAVRVVPRDNLVTTSGRNVIFFTDQRGRASAILSADPFLTTGHGSNEPALEENLAILVGRAAEDYEEKQPTTLDTLRAGQLFTHHRFTGNTLYFGGAIVHDGLEQFVTGLALDLPLINKVHLAIVRNCLEDRVFSPQGWVDFSKIQLALWDPVTDTEVLVGGHDEIFPIICTPDELAFPDFVNSFVLNPLSDMWTPPLVKKYAYDFGLAPYDDEEEEHPPGLVTAGAIAAEFGAGFIPGYDFIDAVRFGLIENLDKDGAQGSNYVLAVIAVAGLAADAGYFAGGAPGAALNACTSAIKVIVKRLGERAVKIIRHLVDGDIVQNLRFLIDYLRKIPTPPGFSWLNPSQVTQHVVSATADTINQWNRVLHSPIGLEEEHLSGALNIIGRRGTRTLSDEATEGASYLLKIGRGAAVEALYDDFAEEVVEAALAHLAAMGRRGFASLPEDAVRGVGRAVDAVGVESPAVRTIIDGVASGDHADRIFANLGQIDDVDGMAELVAYYGNNAPNTSGIHGCVFESTGGRRLRLGEVAGAGALQRVSADGIPGLNRIDTLTENWAVQIKYKANGNMTLANLNPQDHTAAGGLLYLDQMVAQAGARQPVLMTNGPIGQGLSADLAARNILWRQVAP